MRNFLYNAADSGRTRAVYSTFNIVKKGFIIMHGYLLKVLFFFGCILVCIPTFQINTKQIR